MQFKSVTWNERIKHWTGSWRCCLSLEVLSSIPARPAIIPWWRHGMEAFSALFALCAGNWPVPGEFPTQRPVTRSFDVFFDMCLNKRLSKQSRGWWFETLSHSLWRHCNASVHLWVICVFLCQNIKIIPTNIFIYIFKCMLTSWLPSFHK